jgi:hypothetical protein
MPAKTSPEDNARARLVQWLERGEDAVAQIIADLLRNPAVRERLRQGVGRAAGARRQVDENLQFVLSLLNVPSRADYERLAEQLELLQGSLLNVNMKLDRLLAAQQPPAAAARKPAAKRPKRKA